MDVKGPHHIKCSASFVVREMCTHFLKHWLSAIRLARANGGDATPGSVHTQNNTAYGRTRLDLTKWQMCFPWSVLRMRTRSWAGNDTCVCVWGGVLCSRGIGNHPNVWDTSWNHGERTRWKTQLLQGMDTDIKEPPSCVVKGKLEFRWVNSMFSLLCRNCVTKQNTKRTN